MTTSIVDDLKEKYDGILASISVPAENRLFVELTSSTELSQMVEFLTKEHHARLITITCVDMPAAHELLYHFEISRKVLTLRSMLWKPKTEMPSVSKINPAAELVEHEISELFGLRFLGNPRQENMILAQDSAIKIPLENRRGQIDSRIDGNLSVIIEHGSTTAPSKRVMKSRTQMGMSENPPLCSFSCPAKAIVRDIAEKSGTTSRHPNLKKEVEK